MKKLLKALLLTSVALPMLAACDNSPKDPRSAQEIIEENALTAVGQVGITYNGWSASAGLSKDATLVKSVAVEGYIYSFDYNLTTNYTYTTEFAKIVEDGEELKLKVTVPEDTQLPEEKKDFAAYKLTATVKFTGLESGTKAKSGYKEFINTVIPVTGNSWNIRINATVTLEVTAAELYTSKELVSGKTRVITYGIYMGSETDPNGFVDACSNKKTLYFDDGEYSFAAYDASWTAMPQLELNKVYKVVGIYTDYYGTIEITAPTFTLANDHACQPGVPLVMDSKISADLIKDKSHACRKCTVTGTIVKVAFSYADSWEWNNSKASVYINITGAKKDGKLVSEGYAYVHGFDLQSTYETWSKSGINKDTVGGTVTFSGRAYWYSGTPTWYATTLLSYTPAE